MRTIDHMLIGRMLPAAEAAGLAALHARDNKGVFRFGPVHLASNGPYSWHAWVAGCPRASGDTARAALREAYYMCEDLELREQIRPVYVAAGLLG